MRSLRQATSFALVLAAMAFAPPSAAVGTRTFDLDTLDDFSGGDLKGVAVGSDGTVRAGFLLGDVKVEEASTIFAGMPLADGSGVLLGTSPHGKVIKVAGDQATEFADTKETGVTSLAQDARGNVYAATFPDGKIFKVSQGKAELFCTLPETTYVWALAFDKSKTNLFAATGLDEGRVFRINLAGQPEVYFRSDEPHLVSLAVAPNGDVLAGSSGKALLYRITGPGRATVLYDFGVKEVKAIAAAPNGTIWAIANDYTDSPEPPKRSSSAGRTAAGPSSNPHPAKPGKGALWRFDPQGRPEKMMSHSEFHYMALALDDAGTPYVGTGAEGRVYTVDDAHAVSLVADTDERQVAALSMAGLPKGAARPGIGAFVASSDGAVFHRVLGKGGADAVWTSKVFDMGIRARFGAMTFRATGALDLSTRTGNTAAPDKTWSEWSNPIPSGNVVPSPSARYVQVRARFQRAPAAELQEVLLPFVTDNLRAVVTDVTAQSKSATKESKEGLVASGGEVPKHDSVVKVSWKVENPDQDTLRYRLSYRQQGATPGAASSTAWRDMLRSDEILTAKTDYDWETATLPEGRYEVRVEASDEPSNPPDQVQRHALDTSNVLVDNTPPTFPVATLAGRKLKARVVDGVGPITRVDVSIDGHAEWRPLAPVDHVFDSATESFDADLSSFVPPGSHIVALRAFDAAGNYVVREIMAQP